MNGKQEAYKNAMEAIRQQLVHELHRNGINVDLPGHGLKIIFDLTGPIHPDKGLEFAFRFAPTAQRLLEGMHDFCHRHGISGRVESVLLKNGILTLGTLVRCTRKQIVDLRRGSDRIAETLERLLAKDGFSFGTTLPWYEEEIRFYESLEAGVCDNAYGSQGILVSEMIKNSGFKTLGDITTAEYADLEAAFSFEKTPRRSFRSWDNDMSHRTWLISNFLKHTPLSLAS
jgi:hypothetical protein